MSTQKAEKGKVLTVDIATENTGDTQAFIDNTDFNAYDKRWKPIRTILWL
ncbi:hypothetical protein G3M54_01385 [Bacillus megaterium NBRC 15308 = ATCC 14581]|nr:hypothetical protein [Priestia megaterium NBRC 15308 = ATCC 14581]